jgi:hypothetical protein
MAASWVDSAVAGNRVEAETLDAHVIPAALPREANALAVTLEAFRVAVDTAGTDPRIADAAERAFRTQLRCFDDIAAATAAAAEKPAGADLESIPLSADDAALVHQWLARTR